MAPKPKPSHGKFWRCGFPFSDKQLQIQQPVSVLRKYLPADRAQVVDLHERALLATGALVEHGMDDDLRNIEETYVRPGGCFYVMDEDGAVIAMGALRLHGNDEGEIKRMRVEPSQQHRGYGQTVLDALIKAAKNRGISRLYLDTTSQQTAAQKFYEKNGFQEFRRQKLQRMTVIYYEMSLHTAN